MRLFVRDDMILLSNKKSDIQFATRYKLKEKKTNE